MPSISKPIPEFKTCSKCGVVKPPSEYYAKVRSPLRLFSWCKQCHAGMAKPVNERTAATRAWQKANPDRAAEINRGSKAKHADRLRVEAREKYAEKRKAKKAAYRKANAERIKARNAAYRLAHKDAIRQ